MVALAGVHFRKIIYINEDSARTVSCLNKGAFNFPGLCFLTQATQETPPVASTGFSKGNKQLKRSKQQKPPKHLLQEFETASERMVALLTKKEN